MYFNPRLLATVLRIDDDVPWNQPAANNLGLKYIYMNDPSAQVLRSDMDHFFTLDDLMAIEDIKLKPKTILHFKRGDIRPHPNVYLARARDLLEAGGYNEDFCGNYGYDDLELMDRLRKKGFIFELSEISARVKNDMKTKGLNRDFTINREKYEKLMKP